MYACCRQVALGYAYNRGCGANSALSLFTRWYARGLKRTPIAVRTPEDDTQRLKAKGVTIKDPRLNPSVPYVPGDPTQDQFRRKVNQQRLPSDKHNAANLQQHHHQQQQQRTNTKAAASNSAARSRRDFTSSGLQYEKLEDGDKRFGRVLMAAKSRKEREKSGIILMEGRRLIVDALLADVELKYLYFSDVSHVSGLPLSLLGDAELFRVQYRHLKMWADTHTPAGMLGVFAKPALGEVLCPQRSTLPLTLICDNVRDPGNMGTIIRTAAAAGCRKIITTKGCVDVWDPKVLRGAMGGHFYTSILCNLSWENIANHVSSSHLYVVDTRKSGDVEKSFDVAHPEVMALLADADADSSADSTSSDDDTDDDSHTLADRGDRLSGESEMNEDVGNAWSKAKSESYRRVPLSIVAYSDMDCSLAEDVAVIVGGETEGVSAQAKKLAFEKYGHFVTIPMVEAVDSLNTATAAAIVLYEARRQIVARIKSQRRKPAQDLHGAA